MPFDEELFGLALDFANSPELPALKKRFEGFGACKDMATAAAFGYLAAMKDAEAKEEGPTIGDNDIALRRDWVLNQVVVAIEEAMEGETDAEYAGEMIMALVYQWLHKEMNEDGWDDDDYAITCIKSLFTPFVRPGVIKQ